MTKRVAVLAFCAHNQGMEETLKTARLIDTGNVQLEYEDCGEGDVLVLLHGLGCSARDWGLQMPALSRHHRVIAPSLRGFGESDSPSGPSSIMQYAEDVVALLDALDIDRAHVFGHSMGGAVALQMAVAFQPRLLSLIVVNAQASFALRDWRRYILLLMRFMAQGPAGMERLTRFLARRLFPHEHQRELRQRMAKRYSTNDRRAYLAALHALAGWSVEDLVDRVRLPTLVLAGQYDVTPLEESRAFTRKMARASLKVVPDSGHATPFDQHDVVNDLVIDFLKTTRWARGEKTSPMVMSSSAFRHERRVRQR